MEVLARIRAEHPWEGVSFWGIELEYVWRLEALAMTQETAKFITGCASYSTFDKRKIHVELKRVSEVGVPF